MFIPIGDTPNPERFTPYVNYGLIGLNVAIYLLVALPLSMGHVSLSDPGVRQYIDVILPTLDPRFTAQDLLQSMTPYDLYVFEHGYKPAAPQIGDLFYAMFLHGGFMHLAGNMLFLWIYGDNVEHRLGRIGYLVAYLFTGVAATLGFSIVAAGSMTPLVGASGAISGVLGIYFLLFPRNKVKVFFAFFPFFNVFLIPARWVLGFFVLFENFLPLISGSRSNVAFGAHLGGFFTGLGIAWLGEHFSWRAPWKNKGWRQGSQRKKRNGKPDSAQQIRLVHDSLAEGNFDRALEEVMALSNAEIAQMSADDCVRFSEWLHSEGHPIAATNLLRRCIVTHRGGASQNLAKLYLALGLLRLSEGYATSAYQHILTALDLDPDPETEQKARNALQKINIYRPN